MTKISTLSSVVILSISFFSCSQKSTSGGPMSLGNWVRRSDLDGPSRTQGVSIVIGDTAYVATGKDGTTYMERCLEI